MTDPRAIPMIEAQGKARAEKIKELKAEIARLREENAELKRWDALRESMAAAAQELKADNARLREEQGEMTLVLHSQDENMKRLIADMGRLHEAIKREAVIHSTGLSGTAQCVCELCEIAREGR